MRKLVILACTLFAVRAAGDGPRTVGADVAPHDHLDARPMEDCPQSPRVVRITIR
jgi:hypothetical protein